MHCACMSMGLFKRYYDYLISELLNSLIEMIKLFNNNDTERKQLIMNLDECPLLF